MGFGTILDEKIHGFDEYIALIKGQEEQIKAALVTVKATQDQLVQQECWPVSVSSVF